MRAFLASLLSVAAGIVSIGAGIYLLTHHSPPIVIGGSAGQSWLEVLAHGIGVYFVARGLWMFAETLRYEDD